MSLKEAINNYNRLWANIEHIDHPSLEDMKEIIAASDLMSQLNELR